MAAPRSSARKPSLLGDGFHGLPKYDANGSKYDYMVVEGALGYFQQHQYMPEDPETGLPNVTKIWNKPGSGGSSIRQQACMGINTSAAYLPVRWVYLHPTIFEDGKLKYAEDEEIGEATLSYEERLFRECYVPVDGPAKRRCLSASCR